MNKSELLNWLHQEYAQWQAFLDQIGPSRMDQPGVSGAWSMKDIIAHLAGWNRNLIACIRAAQRGEPEPAPPWPVHLKFDHFHDDHEPDVRAWLERVEQP